jgi:hypothetical protein
MAFSSTARYTLNVLNTNLVLNIVRVFLSVTLMGVPMKPMNDTLGREPRMRGAKP